MLFVKEEGLQKPVPTVAQVLGVKGPLEPPSRGRAYGPQAVFGRQALQNLQTVPLGQTRRALELRRQRLPGAARDLCPRHARAVWTRQARPSQGSHPAG